ncbi:hypothetical protein KKA57_02570, partial [Patescibacteria group bacterium]|nr:hypothetical protein [Patescibacteria group bacterium]
FMNKKLLFVVPTLLFAFVFMALVPLDAVEAKKMTAKKQTWVSNHYDAKVFEYKDMACAAGPFGNAINTYCTAPGKKAWKAIEKLNDAGKEFISLEDAWTYNGKLYFAVLVGVDDSNNDTRAVEVWKLGNNGWNKVMTQKGKSMEYVGHANTSKKAYVFVHRSDKSPYTFYYTSKKGNTWKEPQAVNTPWGLDSVTSKGGKIWGIDDSKVYKLNADGTWITKYYGINTGTEKEYFQQIIGFKGKLYIAAQHWTWDGGLGEWVINDKVMSSEKGVSWSSKSLTDTSGSGNDLLFTRTGKQLWMLSVHQDKTRDVMWRINKNIRKIGSDNKRTIKKNKSRRINGKYFIGFSKVGKKFFFADQFGNIYRNK